MEAELFEKIDYDLCIYGDVTGESQRHRFMIVKTLARIPKDVRERVLDETIFVIAYEGVFGATFVLKTTSPETLSFLLLNFGELEGRSEPAILSTIAHEIAHCVLEHRILGGGRDAEIDADHLIGKWGFERVYKDYNQFRK